MMRVLRLKQVAAMTGIGWRTVLRKEEAGEFPRRIRLGPNSVGWLEGEVEDWISARAAERDATSIPAKTPEALAG